ncbi:hypothetical protein O6H91_02G103500 [Diphasiastrum complanatum]|uniref:Uncharacterized protein n=1 Tax=Diphasiastrum complanatum TaxID=34168 RepID=A0ACC2EIL7_DIPCM|nr:hypothetical protein O6H91_02G103500 [Diphasiastrum complanatum]
MPNLRTTVKVYRSWNAHRNGQDYLIQYSGACSDGYSNGRFSLHLCRSKPCIKSQLVLYIQSCFDAYSSFFIDLCIFVVVCVDLAFFLNISGFSRFVFESLDLVARICFVVVQIRISIFLFCRFVCYFSGRSPSEQLRCRF